MDTVTNKDGEEMLNQNATETCNTPVDLDDDDDDKWGGGDRSKHPLWCLLSKKRRWQYRVDWEPEAASRRRALGVFWRCPATLWGPSTPAQSNSNFMKDPCFENLADFS